MARVAGVAGVAGKRVAARPSSGAAEGSAVRSPEKGGSDGKASFLVLVLEAASWKRPREVGKRGGGKRSQKSKALPVKLEIASGTGDWIIAQALADEGKAHWAALEIKHDRVAAILSRMRMCDASNLALIGGDGGQVLRDHLKPRSVAHIFVNFPEPPHRSGDEDAVQVFSLHPRFSYSS